MMDKKTVIAFILIGLLLVITQTNWYKESVLGLKPLETTKESLTTPDNILSTPEEAVPPIDIRAVEKKSTPASFRPAVSDTGRDIHITTKYYQAVVSSRGATIKSWQFLDYFYDKEKGIPVQLIKNDGYGNLGIHFLVDSDTIYTRDHVFSVNKNEIILGEDNPSESIAFELTLDVNRILRKIFTFHSDSYLVDLKIELINLGSIISDQKYTLEWLSGLQYTEKNLMEDMNNAKAYIFTGGIKEELDLPNKVPGKKELSPIEGKIDWIGIRTKYFLSVILPETDDAATAHLSGTTSSIDNKNVLKNYSASLQMKIPEYRKNQSSQNFKVYVGPLDYSIVKQYHSGFDKIMGYGPAIIRPFSKLVIHVFEFIHRFISNYGLVLIVFSILVKIVVYPLTHKSNVSMQEMQRLQPLLSELKEKYGKDPQRLNKETMKLYKEHGVNPFSGCLPMILQMPLLWSIFLVFRNTIQLRQQPFVAWITDLSSPDSIGLPFSLPLIGSSLHIIPLVMGVTMFIQQKMTMKDPKQKAMVYFMPIFLTFLFYSFPSGLNLYYTLFNILSMIQQWLTPMKHDQDREVKVKSKRLNPFKRK